MSGRRRRRGGFLMFAGTVLLAAAFVVAWLNIQEDRSAGEASRMIAAQMRDAMAQQAAQQQAAGPEAELPAVAAEPVFVINPGMEMPLQRIDGHDYIGMLDIPKLERSLPVMAEWSYPKLKLAPCLYEGSIYSHDAVISAHNYEEHLRYLWQLEPGDEVRFTDVDGNVFIYAVTIVEVLMPDEVERMITPDNWDLTVFTCKAGGRARITARCELTSVIAAAQ